MRSPYSPHLRKQPLAGVPAKSVIIQFAKGDQSVPNPTSTAMLRAGNLAHRATYYRHDLAFADPMRNPTGIEVPKDSHLFLVFDSFLDFFPAVGDVGAGARQQIAEFFASDSRLQSLIPMGQVHCSRCGSSPRCRRGLNFIP